MRNTQETNSESKADTSARERLDVILPAGGRITGEFAQMAGTEIKALIDFHGQTILRRAIQTLRATGRVGRIVVIGSPETLAEAQAGGADGLLPEGDSGPDNILRGLTWLQAEGERGEFPTPEHLNTGTPSSKVLILTTDLPFLTSDALNTFLDACPPDADIALPIVTAEEFTARFPGTQNEFVRLKDGSYTLGCAFVVDGAALLRNEAHLRAVFAARKSQWQMARLIGFGTILKFATRKLTVEELEARASAIAGCKGVALRHMPPELAYDIDLPAEYLYAREHAERPPSPEVSESNAVAPAPPARSQEILR